MREEAKNTPQRLVFLFPPWKNPIKISELFGKSARLLKAPEILQTLAFFPPKRRIWDGGVASSFPPLHPDVKHPRGTGRSGARQGHGSMGDAGMELLGCRASVMFPWDKQTSPSTNPASPEPIHFVAEPYGQSRGMIFPQELSIPLQSMVPTLTPSPPPSGAWGGAGMQGTGDWDGIFGVK